MEEYILYVILIFIPIGGAMAYLLHKDGLPGKYINIIVILSLFIVLSFPISMERLGGLASLMIYVLLIAVMSWYILKGRAGDLALSTCRLPVGNQFINLLNRVRSAIPVTNETPENDETCIGETIEEIPEKEEMPEDTMEKEIAAEADIITDEGLESESSLVDSSAPARGADEITPIIEQKVEETSELTTELTEEKTAAVQPTTENEVAPGVDSEKGETVVEADLTPERDETMAEVDLTPEKVETVAEADLTPEKVETVAEADLTPEVIPEEKQEEEHLPEAAAGSEDIELPKDINVEVEPQIPEPVEPAFANAQINEIEEISEPPIEEQDSASISIPDSSEPKTTSSIPIIELIDNGFACRDSNKEQAARYFEEAWQTTSDSGLRYMLTLELVEIYKESGWYSEARAILNSFIALPGHKSDIINEINRQIDYISLLTAELERLGISDLPISRVPRWVRLKVDGEMNPPGV
jgi:hypothetical protein